MQGLRGVEAMHATFHRPRKGKAQGPGEEIYDRDPLHNSVRASINLACVQPNRNMNLILNFDQALCKAGRLPIIHYRLYPFNTWLEGRVLAMNADH